MAAYLSSLLKSRDAVKEIRVFGLGKPFLRRFRNFWQQYFAATKRVAAFKGTRECSFRSRIQRWNRGYLDLCRGTGHLEELSPLETSYWFSQAAERSRSMLESFFRTTGRLYEDTLFAENLLSFLDLPPDSVEGALSRGNRSQFRVPRPIQKGIEFGMSHFIIHAQTGLSLRIYPLRSDQKRR